MFYEVFRYCRVKVRLIYAREPGPALRAAFDRYPELAEGLERLLCPRIHFKTVVVDGTFAYSGSATLTGAGMGAKSENRRNFEVGFITFASMTSSCHQIRVEMDQELNTITGPNFLLPVVTGYNILLITAECERLKAGINPD